MSFTGRSQDYLTAEVINAAFFPALSLGEFQEVHRIDTKVAQATVEQQVRVAMADINQQLATAVAAWQAAGFASLIAVDASDLGMRVDLYKAALFQTAKAHILRDHQTFARRDIANNEAGEGQDAYRYLIARARRAIRMLTGAESRRIDAELL